MANLLLLVVCFLLGILLRRSGRLPAAAPAALNGFIIYVSLPALTLLYVHGLRPSAALAYPALMPWLLFALGLLFFRTAGRLAGWPRRTVGALILTGSLGMTSFVGIPMIQAFYGPDGVGIGIVADQLGSFLVLSTLGLAVAAAYSGDAVRPAEVARRIALFPPFQALLLAVALMPLSYPTWLAGMLLKLGDTLTPLALVSVGYQLRLGHLRGNGAKLALGLGFKLVLGPVLLLLLALALGTGGQVIQITLFEAAMAPMITGAIVAVEHDLDPPLVNLMVGVGMVVSFATLPAWWYLLRGV